MKISARKTKRGDGWAEREGEGGSWRRGVLPREMAAAKAWLPGGRGWTFIRGRSKRARRGVMSRKQGGVGVLVECRGGVVEGEELDPNLHLFFPFFYFYHVFIIFRYKKLRAVLAMQRTKPINQNKTQKKPNSQVHHWSENNLAKTTCQRSQIREKKSISKF